MLLHLVLGFLLEGAVRWVLFVLSDAFCVSVVVPLSSLFIVRGCTSSFPSVIAAVHGLSSQQSSLLTPYWFEPLIS